MADDVHSADLGVSEDLWKLLLVYVERQQVIPVVGPGLSTVKIDGRSIPTDQYLAEQLAKHLSPPISDLPPSPTLAHVVARHLERKGGDTRLYSLVETIVGETVADASFVPSEPLMKLAKITDFKLFVTTTLDYLLEQALDAARHDGERKTLSLSYNPQTFDDCAKLSDIRVPTVYHLFGKPFTVPGSYVISDGDLLEFLHKLQSPEGRPKQLFDNLRDSHLLLLGGALPDWLVRFFLRVAKAKKLSSDRVELEILADDRWRNDPALVSFLANFSPQTTIFQAGGPEFIDELWRRWSAKHVEREEHAAAPNRAGKIFLSYSRRDLVAAKTMCAELQAHGFDVWFDKNDIVGGDWDPAIETEIRRCSMFMPLLSSNTHAEQIDAVFRREWDWALQRDTKMAEHVAFIVPVVIDDFPRGNFDDLPARMRPKHIELAPGGHVTDDLHRIVRAALGDRV